MHVCVAGSAFVLRSEQQVSCSCSVPPWSCARVCSRQCACVCALQAVSDVASLQQPHSTFFMVCVNAVEHADNLYVDEQRPC